MWEDKEMSKDIHIIVRIKNDLYFALQEKHVLYRHTFVSRMCDKYDITAPLVYKVLRAQIKSGELTIRDPVFPPFKNAKILDIIEVDIQRPNIKKVK